MVKIIVGVMGTSPFKVSSSMSNAQQIDAFLQICSKYGVTEIDTARVYADGESERMLGQVNASERFQVSTKANISMNGAFLKREMVLKSADESLEYLQTIQVDIFYLHRPDLSTPIEETLEAIDELYKQGKFKRFGISNYRAEEVEEIYQICQKKNYVLPSVYQGNYNAIARNPETGLFPVLRRLGIAFYGFGATAGGLLAKPIEELKNPKEGTRWDALPILKTAYGKDVILSGVEDLQEKCEEEHISILEASLRWEKYHSALGENDGVLLGASSNEQIEENLKAIEKGPLPQSLVAAYEDMWKLIQSEAPSYHH